MIGGTPKHTLWNKVWIFICQKNPIIKEQLDRLKNLQLGKDEGLKGSLKLSLSVTAHTQNFNNLKEETMEL